MKKHTPLKISIMSIALIGYANASITFTTSGATNDATDASVNGTVIIEDDVSNVTGIFVFEDPTDRTISQGAGLTANYSFSVSGGTGDLTVQSTGTSAADDPNGDQYERIRIEDLNGASEFTFTVSYSEFLGARDDGNLNSGAVGFDRSRPLGGGIGILTTGSTANTAYTVNVSYDGVVSATTLGGTTFQSGLPTDAEFIGIGQDNFETSTGTTFTSTDGFSGNVGTNGASNANYLGFRAVDYDGDGAVNASELQNVYVDEISFTVIADSGTFSDDTVFAISLDGEQFPNVVNIPEPASVSLLGLGALGFAFRRNRR